MAIKNFIYQNCCRLRERNSMSDVIFRVIDLFSVDLVTVYVVGPTGTAGPTRK